MGEVREVGRKHHAQHERDHEQLKAEIATISNRVARMETSTREQISDIQGRVGMYLQSLEMQLAEVLERLAARVVEVERFQQRQARVHHDVLDAIADLRLQIHREGVVVPGVSQVAGGLGSTSRRVGQQKAAQPGQRIAGAGAGLASSSASAVTAKAATTRVPSSLLAAAAAAQGDAL